LDVADGERPERLAVIAVREGEEAALRAPARVVPEMKAHLHRHLDRGRAVVGIDAAGEAGGGDRTELLRERDHRLVGEACEDHLLELLELRAHRGVDAGIRVPEVIHPPGADGIKVALALVILEPRALAAAHGDRRQLLVVLHLRARMPHVREVARDVCGVGGAHGRNCGRIAAARSLSVPRTWTARDAYRSADRRALRGADHRCRYRPAHRSASGAIAEL